jgi:hypothetical protein
VAVGLGGRGGGECEREEGVEEEVGEELRGRALLLLEEAWGGGSSSLASVS